MDVDVVLTIVGLVIAVVIGVWQIYLAYPKRSDEKPSSNAIAQKATEDVTVGNQSMNHGLKQSASSNLGDDFSSPSPMEIIEQIKSLPLAQQASARKSYEGLKVYWQVTLQAAHEASGGRTRLMTLAGNVYPWVILEVDLSSQMEILLSKKETPLVVTGAIQKVENHTFYLDGAHVALLKLDQIS